MVDDCEPRRDAQEPAVVSSVSYRRTAPTSLFAGGVAVASGGAQSAVKEKTASNAGNAYDPEAALIGTAVRDRANTSVQGGADLCGR